MLYRLLSILLQNIATWLWADHVKKCIPNKIRSLESRAGLIGRLTFFFLEKNEGKRSKHKQAFLVALEVNPQKRESKQTCKQAQGKSVYTQAGCTSAQRK